MCEGRKGGLGKIEKRRKKKKRKKKKKKKKKRKKKKRIRHLSVAKRSLPAARKASMGESTSGAQFPLTEKGKGRQTVKKREEGGGSKVKVQKGYKNTIF
jgi:hypothetical protein